MLPVPGYVPPPGLGIGTAIAFSVTVGAADAKLGAARAASARTARQVDALRISSLSSVDDRSASIRVAPEPCRSGDIEISGERRRTVAIFFEPYPSNTAGSSSKRWDEGWPSRGLANASRDPNDDALLDL